MLWVRVSIEPERYLGLSNVVSRDKKKAFQKLKDRMNEKIGIWSKRHLSQGGKEVFIKSILQAIPTYIMFCFLLPNSFCTDLESIISRFWWSKNSTKRGIYWCS